MRSRKGMELATNTIVVMILGVVLLALGIALVTRIVDQGQDYVQDVDEQLMEQLRRSQFNDGKLVAVLNPHETVQRGEKAYFLLGYVNKDDEKRTFATKVVFSERSPINDTLNEDDKGSIDDYVLYPDDSRELQPNQDEFHWIAFTPPRSLPPGEYYYDVYVCFDGQEGAYVDQCDSGNKLYGGTKQRLFITLR